MPRLRLLPEITTVYTQQEAAKVLEYLMRRGGPIAIDTETTGLDVMRARVLCWSMATENQRYFIPVEYLLFFDPLFQRKDVTWYLANAKFDLHMLANMGVHIAGPVWDIVVMDAMDDDTRAHGLKEQSMLAYGVRWGDFKELFLDPEYVAQALGLDKKAFTQFKKLGTGERLTLVWNEKPEIVENYASCDAYFTYMRAEDLKRQLAATPTATDMVPGLQSLFDYFYWIEAPFTKVLWRMERCGVPVDLDYVKRLDIPLREGLRARELKIKELLGPTFNPRSNDELRELFFTKAGFNLTPVSYTGKGKTPTPGVSEDDLRALQGRARNQRVFDAITEILKFRELDKLHGTYVKKIHAHLGPDGRIHCKFNQTGARTGRLSASNPNLQNLPKQADDSLFKIRGMFVAPPGMKMTDFDYPQIQPRLAAIFAGEEALMEDIRNGYDIHSANAKNMYQINHPEATYEAIQAAKEAKEKGTRALTDLDRRLLAYRAGAKTVGLGVLFGEGPTKMAHQLEITVDEAKELAATFFRTYPNIKKLIDDMHHYGHMTETTYTMLGRLRRLHKINNEYNYGIVAAEERIAFNCLDEKTEALTQRGWVRGFALRSDDILLTKNLQTGALEWQPLLDLKLFDNYTGDLVEFRSKTFNALSTPNHRWPVYNKATRRNECRVTAEISDHGDHRIHRTGDYAGAPEAIYSDDFVELLGWACTDGGYPTKHAGVRLYQSRRANPANVRRIDALLKRLKISYNRRLNKETQGVTWEIHAKHGTKIRAAAPQRELHPELLLKLTRAQLQRLLEVVIAADGWETAAQTTIGARNERHGAAIQLLCILCGKAANLRKRDYRKYGPRYSRKVQAPGVMPTKPSWLVSVLRRDKVQVTKAQKKIHRVQNAKIWCPVVANTYFVARREGQVFQTGNTLIQGSEVEVMKCAMLQIDANEDFRSLGGQLCLTVHDELLAFAPNDTVKEVVEIQRSLMADPLHWGPIDINLPIPVDPDGSFGDRWSELH